MLALGRNLTPFPKPIEGGELVTHGPYRFVRHPIYAGLIFGTLGWALFRANLLGLALAVLLFIFFDLKSRREERWLCEAYPDYEAYQQRVKKLVPWVY
jgi:protein-S-isoprenylcysteine O-methyltransferase Ste14